MLLWLYSEPATMSRVSLTEMIGLWQWVRGQSRIRYRMTVATAMWVEQPDRINTFESPLIPYTLWYCWNWKGFLPVAQRAIKSSSSRFIAAFTSTLNFENLLVALIKLIRGRGCISSSQTAPSAPPLPHFASWPVWCECDRRGWRSSGIILAQYVLWWWSWWWWRRWGSLGSCSENVSGSRRIILVIIT